MQVEYFVVDAFTRKRFGGNNAAIVEVENWLSDALMQQIAIENNLSETAFLKPTGNNHYEIRWFSPITEIDFCGHATLAAAYVLFNHKGKSGEIKFQTQEVGTLTVKQVADGRIVMEFPNLAPELTKAPDALLEGLNVTPTRVLKNRQAYFVIVETEQQVRSCEYDSDKLKTLAPFDVVVTAKGDDVDFVSRYFWPANGGDEDPVTGSIHAGLAPYWAKALNKQKLHAHQASKRGGELFCEVTDTNVIVSGFGVLYAKGIFEIEDE
ncbi:PhzF family phenazine biosynthesis protein [Pseudoalteromonas piscicida]|uniref:PhzF family phenazine biosynthesis protein n=1 Tax=Pseudoalteromonas piscicida TaxID=43662 RepID=UPI001EFD0711|nr:PhzF family phenazine biosynthesis protein [Pseudoalteromonas piscicida]MCG9768737.1 PhzF family phenazine biosynthesis protein [Pseudoalteromonas piscicida]